jgi:hypothetical protein
MRISRPNYSNKLYENAENKFPWQTGQIFLNENRSWKLILCSFSLEIRPFSNDLVLLFFSHYSIFFHFQFSFISTKMPFIVVISYWIKKSIWVTDRCPALQSYQYNFLLINLALTIMKWFSDGEPDGKLKKNIFFLLVEILIVHFSPKFSLQNFFCFQILTTKFTIYKIY